MKKLLTILLSAVLVLSLVACGGSKGTAYTKTVTGMHEGLTVETVITDGHIDSVTVKEHQETEGVSDKAISDIPTAIVEHQSLNVAVVSGATLSSNGIIEAVKQAIVEAGLNPDDYMGEVNVEKEDDVTLDVDVVVVGSGGAGLAAAVEAGKTGSKVLVVEKAPKIGGNTLICGGGYNAVDPGRQDPMGIEDSTDLFFEQTMKGGDNEADPELVRVLVDNAYDGVTFLEEYGMVWQTEVSTAPGGLYQRRHMPGNGALGVPMINALKNGCDQNGVEIMTDTHADKIIMKDGAVAGIECTGKTGNKITINAAKGVVLATGGFGANVTMREEYNTLWPTLGEQVLTTNVPGATGDGIEMAKEAGAQLVDMEFIQLFPYGDPKTGAMTGSIMKQPENAVYLNKEGVRFVNEYGRRDEVSAEILKQTDSIMFVVVDGKTYPDDNAPTDFGTTIGEEVEAGRSVKGNTIEELATAMNMDPAVVKAAIDEYNAGVDANADKYGKTPMNRIDTAPFFGSPRTPVVHHTMGGIKITTNAEVVGQDGNVIPNLFAAGECTGDIHGTNRVGANALTDIIVFGRIAGQNAAK